MLQEVFWIKEKLCPECSIELVAIINEKIVYQGDWAKVYYCKKCRQRYALNDNQSLVKRYTLQIDDFNRDTQFLSYKYIDDGSEETKKILAREKKYEELYIARQAKEKEAAEEKTRKLREEAEKSSVEGYRYLYETYKDIRVFLEFIHLPLRFREILAKFYKEGDNPITNAANDTKIPKELQNSIKNYLTWKEEEDLKQRAEKIKNYFEENYNSNGSKFTLDTEQSIAVADNSQHVLISARAGSGKTRVVAARILYLHDCCHEPIESILALTFNVVVKDEINTRVSHDIRRNGQKNDRQLSLASTFHSLANRCAPNHEKILADVDRKRFIRLLIEEMKDTVPDFQKRVYNAFRSENFEVDRHKFSSEESYYTFIRNSIFTTLNGENVKSLGEKWIADFLYEHGIPYIYEWQYYPSYIKKESLLCSPEKAEEINIFLDQNQRKTERGGYVRKAVVPDFYLPDYNLIWEHWGINENATDEEKKNFSQILQQTWEEYKKHKDWKIKFWNYDWNHLLRKGNKYLDAISSVSRMIQTDVGMLRNGRESFEQLLASILIRNGIKLQKRNERELIQEVWERQLTHFSGMMEHFIDKYEQMFPGFSVSVAKTSFAGKKSDGRTNDFTMIGLDVVDTYNRIFGLPSKPLRLKAYNNYNCDFNQLLHKASLEIDSGRCNSIISPLKYLIIDEYQDFSQLFFNFINGIMKKNVKIQLFCVGDSWQAINRFMGADTEYFDQFNRYFPENKQREITRNYRSDARIVDQSSRFMKNNGFSGRPALAMKLGKAEISVKDIKDVVLEMREGNPNYQKHQKYQKLLSAECNVPIIGKYMMYCLEIIDNAIKAGDDKILLLMRKNKFKNKYEKEEVERKIRQFLVNSMHYCEADAGKVFVRSMHGSKGDEADTVILLEANEKQIPLIHPDNGLFSIFGVTEDQIVEDEMRLFYVAVTRAKKKLYITYDTELSSFVKVYMKGNSYGRNI